MTRGLEERLRIGEASKLRWADPEYRKRQSESRRLAWVKRKVEWERKTESATKKRRCKVCKAGFVPRFTRGLNAQKYCSEKCRDTASMRRTRARPEYKARIAERWAHDASFRETRLAAQQRWRERNPENAKAARLKWVSKNLEHLAEYQRGRRKSNPEKFRQQQRDWYHRLRDAARRKKPGAKRNPVFAEAYRLRQNIPALSWGQIAIKLLPKEYRLDAERTVDKLKKGVRYLRAEKLKAKP